MLTISKPLSSAQAQAYHKLEFTSETQSYYKQGGVVEGQWQGQLADKFGLTGPVTEEAFARLADGKHPETEEQLVRHRLAQTSTGPDGKTMVEAVAHPCRVGRHLLRAEVRLAYGFGGRRRPGTRGPSRRP